MGVPCGTSSRARDRPIAAALRAQGAPNPRPLRSAQHPLGLPGLHPKEKSRVESANELYMLCARVVHLCHAQGVSFAIENPARAWTWEALDVIVQGYNDAAFLAYFRGLFKVDCAACELGGSRPKTTRFFDQRQGAAAAGLCMFRTTRAPALPPKPRGRRMEFRHPFGGRVPGSDVCKIYSVLGALDGVAIGPRHHRLPAACYAPTCR
mgnify:CR=1 FL=1